MGRRWRYFYPGYVLAFAHTFIGFILAIPYGAGSWEWRDGVLTAVCDRIIGNPGAQTHGWIVFYASEEARERADLRVHENTHVWQGFVMGPIYPLCYGIHFAVRYARGVKHPALDAHAARWRHAYRGIVFEEQAFDTQGEFRRGGRPSAWGA